MVVEEGRMYGWCTCSGTLMDATITLYPATHCTVMSFV